MPEFTVHLTTTASASVKVEYTDEEIAAKDIELIYEDALDQAHGDTPDVCARCGGWGQTYSLELAGEWETYQITDENGNIVWGEGAAETASSNSDPEDCERLSTEATAAGTDS